MNNREMALDYLSRFCTGDVDGLAPLLAQKLQFKGPLFQFSSKNAYLRSLRDGPLAGCGYRVLSVTESDDSVSIYYDYEKSDQVITIAQLFRFDKGKITELLLVFDGRGFA